MGAPCSDRLRRADARLRSNAVRACANCARHPHPIRPRNAGAGSRRSRRPGGVGRALRIARVSEHGSNDRADASDPRTRATDRRARGLPEWMSCHDGAGWGHRARTGSGARMPDFDRMPCAPAQTARGTPIPLRPDPWEQPAGVPDGREGGTHTARGRGRTVGCPSLRSSRSKRARSSRGRPGTRTQPDHGRGTRPVSGCAVPASHRRRAKGGKAHLHPVRLRGPSPRSSRISSSGERDSRRRP